jgi:omega-6 fatty acid desaturase (delta-12 desaturase)
MASTTISAGNKPHLRRNVTATTVDSSDSSAVVSPVDSPRPSASSTSLSSLASEKDDIPVEKKYGKLVDTYGNEFKVPDFTIKDIRDAIPKHCYERSAIRSLSYVARDCLYLAVTFYVFNKFVTPEYIESKPIRAGLWALYTFLQGLFGTGLWVLAHECGHGAFSPSQKLNNFVGWILHSALLVPYFSWQLSHSKHHKATGNMARDMVFLPRTREQQATRLGRMVHELGELTEETPIYTFIHLVGQQTIGWWNYLLTNVTGHNNHERQREGRGKGKKNGLGGGVNHFDPRSPIFDNRDAPYILLSDLGLAITISVLVYLGKTFGWSNMLVWYFFPYMWVNHWLGKFFYFISINSTTAGANKSSQLPSPTCSTPTPPFPTTLRRSGTSSAAPLPPLTASSALSAATSSTASSRPTSCTTTFPPFPSTTPTRPPRPSSPSWASTTAPTRARAPSASSRPCGAPLAGASGSSPWRAPRARPRACCSSATGMGWA